MLFWATQVCEVANVGLFSTEFQEISCNPILFDEMLAIAEARREAQRQRDEVAVKTMHLIDTLATDNRNINRGKDTKAIGSLLAEMFKKPKTEEEEDAELRARIFAAERKRWNI